MNRNCLDCFTPAKTAIQKICGDNEPDKEEESAIATKPLRLQPEFHKVKMTATNSTGSFFYPTSWTIEEIQPQLAAYSRGTGPLVIPYSVTPEALCHSLSENGYLSRPTGRILIVTHGFRNTGDTPWMNQIRAELLTQSDSTVLLLDWGKGADLVAPRYLQAAANIQSVAQWLSGHLVELKKFKPELIIWGIGHSLGAHLLGLAGRSSRGFTRISGMDPAGPGFEKHEFMEYRLRPSDAVEMTDVIHTDGYDSFLDPEDWISPVNHYGTLMPIGTIDFYPNFGYAQPGTGPISTFTIAGSHLRAIDLYIWSINNPGKFQTHMTFSTPPGFETPVKDLVPGETWAEMGFHANSNGSPTTQLAKTGLYYIKTAKSEPWVYANNDDSGSGGGSGGCQIL